MKPSHIPTLQAQCKAPNTPSLPHICHILHFHCHPFPAPGLPLPPRPCPVLEPLLYHQVTGKAEADKPGWTFNCLEPPRHNQTAFPVLLVTGVQRRDIPEGAAQPAGSEQLYRSCQCRHYILIQLHTYLLDHWILKVSLKYQLYIMDIGVL